MKGSLKKNKTIRDIVILRYLYLLAGIIVYSLSVQAQGSDSIVTINYSYKDALYRSGVKVDGTRVPADSLKKYSLSEISRPTSVDTVYIHKVDTIIIKELIYSGYPGLSASPPPKLKTNNTITASIGTANMYDTYLSPLKYKGFSIHLIYEQLRRTTWFDYKFYKQQVFELDLAKGDSPAKNVSEYWALLNYRIGGHYTVYNTDRLRVGIGGLWDINAGVLYNERNGNNPASARAYSNLNISIMASYKFNKFAIRWQIDSPFMGILFSPKYGQSYYEISLGNSVGLVNFASFHNQRALRNYITADVPLGQYIIRVGYMGSFYQTKVHDIQTHHYTNSFVIGFPIEGVKKPREKTKNQYWDGY